MDSQIHNFILEDVNITPEMVFSAVLLFFWSVYIWQTYLSSRQTQIYKTSVYDNIPQEIKNVMDKICFEKSQAYNLDKSNFGFWSGVYGQIEFTIILWFELMPWLWKVCCDQLVSIGYGEGEILQSCLFIIYMSIFSFFSSFPWSYYSTFVIEQKHGFNKQTLPFFIKDKIKMLLLSIVIGLPIMSALIYIIKLGGAHFYLYAWFFTFVVLIFMMFIYPDFIAPLFDRYEPLPEGQLKQNIETLAAQIKFPLKKLYVVEGSKRSAHSNAYFYGFWKNKRIVLYDTLLEDFEFPKSAKELAASTTSTKEEITATTSDVASLQEKNESVASTKKLGCNEEEVLAILGHELGHWKLNHVNYNLIISQINMFLLFFLFGQIMNLDLVFSAFGMPLGAPIMLRLLIIFQFIFSPYNELLDFLITLLTRCFEFQADAFAVSLGRGKALASGLIKLQKDNLCFPINDWLYSAYNFSHPPLIERLRAIANKAKKST